MKIEVVRELEIFSEDQKRTLVRSEDDRYFVVSSIAGATAFDTGLPETLVFESDEEGSEAWDDIAGGSLVSHEEAIEELGRVLDGKPRSARSFVPGSTGELLDRAEKGEPIHPAEVVGAMVEVLKEVAKEE